MAWVKEFDKPPEWVEGKSYTGAIVCGYAWNCPKEKDCQERKATHAFSLNIAKPLHKKPKIMLIQSCLYWNRRGWTCDKPKRRNQEK